MFPGPDGASARLRADQLQLIVDTIPLLVSYIDRDQRYVFNNRTYEAWFGLTTESLRGRLVSEVLGAEAYETLRPIFERVLDGEAIEFEDEMTLAIGPRRYVHVSYLPDRDEHGIVRGFVAMVADISDHKRIERRLEATASLESTMNQVGRVLVAELDLKKVVQVVTDAATGLAGAEFGAFFYNVIDSRGESFTLYTISGVPRAEFDQFPMPRNTKVFEPTFRGAGIVRSDDITKDPRYGKNPPFAGMPEGHRPVRSYLAVPVISRSGETLGGLFFGHAQVGRFGQREEDLVSAVAVQGAIAVDNARLVDQLRRRTQQAEEASRLKDEFLSTASHELRTPLNAILGWTRMLRAGNLPQESAGRALEIIERNARLQAQLVEDLLEASRIITGKLRLDVRTVAMRPVLDAALETVRPAAAAKDIQVECHLDPDIGAVSGDPDRLQQIAWNLLSNAVKFTPPGGQVTVRLTRQDDEIELSVSDSGVGIPPEFMPFVFDRFRQADTGHARQFGGLGLGLAISKQLVELHGGTVSAESAGTGHGATFRVRLHALPLDVAEQVEPQPGGRPSLVPPGAESLAGISVLVVDDEDDSRELLYMMLTSAGAQVRVAESAATALTAIDQRIPDVVLSDVGMPGVSGFDFIRELRERPPTAAVAFRRRR